MNDETWSLFNINLAETIRTLITTIDAILANASPNDITGLVTWGALTCSGIHIAVYRRALYFQAEINRSAPVTSPEREHGWEKPPSAAPEIAHMRLYVKQKLVEAGYENIEVVTQW